MKIFRCFAAFAALAGLLLAAGCASDTVVFAEVFQLKSGQKYYTRHNMWYTDPADMNCLNIQRGAFIPVGTEIEPLNANEFTGNIDFRTPADGRKYRIKFETGYWLVPMRNYLLQTFTVTPPEEMLGEIKPDIMDRIRRGEVIPGMNRREVRFAYGPPPAIRTPNLRNESWIYWIGDAETVRVIFRGDNVVSLLNVND